MFFVFSILNSGCNQSNKSKLNYVGKAAFRRSYAGHEHWSEAKFDSVKKSNPTLMSMGDTTEQKALNILTEMGFAGKDELFISKVESILKDTIVITNKKGSMDTAYINFNLKEVKASLYLQTLNSIDSIPIDYTEYSRRLFQKKLEPDQTFILYLNQYYIMNGDNYEISLYRVL